MVVILSSFGAVVVAWGPFRVSNIDGLKCGPNVGFSTTSLSAGYGGFYGANGCLSGPTVLPVNTHDLQEQEPASYDPYAGFIDGFLVEAGPVGFEKVSEQGGAHTPMSVPTRLTHFLVLL